MKGYVAGIDWINAEPMKYWSHTSATPAEKRKQEIRNAVFSGEVLGARKIDGYYERLIKDEDGNYNVGGPETEVLCEKGFCHVSYQGENYAIDCKEVK